ncbi:diguanylate cyclase domain-containing protein, partial [Devosia sp.]|uniref:diguanylate cyclase domain-containing protein n=1 Tax=Devosia sp. TaxID=1871048 RepID=UPI002AFF53E8
MSGVLDFFLSDHEFALVGLAALICLASSYACASLVNHARRASGRMRWVWTAIAALAVGSGIWATHFVAVLAFRPGFTPAYDLALTGASLGIAILVCGAGIAMAIRGQGGWDHALGGAVVGVAISSMHYTGIFALVMGGTLGWNATGVSISIIAGIGLAGLALPVALSGSGSGWRRRLSGAGLLTLAICAMHFTAMASADFSLCFAMEGEGELHAGWMAAAVTGSALLILGLAMGSALLDEIDRRRTAREAARQQRDAERISEVSGRLELALTHMAQGIGLYDRAGKLQLYNGRMVQMLGLDGSRDLTGLDFREVCRLAALHAGQNPGEIEEITERLMAQHTPLLARGGEVVHQFSDERTLRISHSPVGDGSWVSTIEDITERERSERAIAHLARHDGLTGLPNRALFGERFDAALEDARDSGNKLAVIAIDLDRFKEINDSHGHATGDTVLKILAGRLSEGLNKGEMVARLGGDEFAALKSFASMEVLRDFLQRIETALFCRVEVDGGVVNTGGSIGVAIYPDDETDRSRLLNNADLAMYRAKAEFDRHICYYEREMDETARQRRDLARDIWTALETDSFYLAYQVQKSVQTGEVTGYEVLLRWDRPGHGNVSPADFIPVAEECGAIGAIGNWVLKMACLEAASWPEPYKIAVNISGVQLSQVELIDMVRNVLFLSGLAPERLELEVTETAIIADKQRALHILRQLRAMGVSIAI